MRIHNVLFSIFLTSCAEPFPADRHDLLGFRIAALGTKDGIASAAVWSGLGLWHERSPQLIWSVNGTEIGSGYNVSIPAGAERLSLHAISPDGDQYFAEVSVAEKSPEEEHLFRIAI